MLTLNKIKHYSLTLALGFFLIFLFTNVFSQTGEKFRILGINVAGSERQDIVRTSGLQSGKEITLDDIQNAIKRLWSRQLFSNIKIKVEKSTYDGVFLLIEVEEYPRLVNEEFLKFNGNKKIKDKDLKKEIDLEAGEVLSDWTINRAKQKILKLYREKGYLMATISPETFKSSTEENRVILQFNIKEANKVQVKKIVFTGNNAFSDGKLRKQMKEIKEDRFWRSADFDEEKFEEDKLKIIEFYRNNGYRDAEIVGDSLRYDDENKDMFIEITVNEGNIYHFGKITWEGNTVFSTEELASRLEFKPGDIYSHEKLVKAQQERVGSLYYDNGYIFSTIPWKEKPVGQDTIDIHWFISEGKPARVGAIEITGNTNTKEKVIRRELKIHPGDIFSKDLVQRSQREVYILNYFSDVQIEPIPAQTGDEINLKFSVKEKSTQTAHMSAGYSERDKMIGNVGVSMNNLFGNGQHLSFDWNFGRYYRSFQISFTEPWLLDTPTLGGFSFYDTKRENAYWQPFKEVSRGGTFRMGRRFRWPDNYFRGDWIYRLDRTDYSDFEDWYRESYPYGIVSQKWPLTVSSVTQIISRNSFDMPEFPTKGSEFSFSAELAGGPLGGSADYHKYILEAKWFTPIWWKFVLYSNVMTGLIAGLKPGNIVPTYEMFYMGGDGLTRAIPLRGYEDPYAGSWVREVGGRSAIKYSTEFRVQIIPNPTMFGLVFAEAGNTWSSLKETDPMNLRRSIGVGARLFMPMIGIIGFDYAYGFDYYDSHGNRSGKWVPHFVFGRGF
ncbi:outer membrane protein assembly factor BamA [candidate division KSB1 bacterium]|nr:outer membrane protein assembly factor BamA [candidate division KSB1 bacterium]